MPIWYHSWHLTSKLIHSCGKSLRFGPAELHHVLAQGLDCLSQLLPRLVHPLLLQPIHKWAPRNMRHRISIVHDHSFACFFNSTIRRKIFISPFVFYELQGKGRLGHLSNYLLIGHTDTGNQGLERKNVLHRSSQILWHHGKKEKDIVKLIHKGSVNYLGRVHISTRILFNCFLAGFLKISWLSISQWSF